MFSELSRPVVLTFAGVVFKGHVYGLGTANPPNVV